MLCAKQCVLYDTQFVYLYDVHRCLSYSLTHFAYNLAHCLFRNLEKYITDRCTIRPWPKMAMLLPNWLEPE
jgi:hypothetical protein